MLCQPKRSCDKDSALVKWAAFFALVGGLAAAAYYGWRLMETMKCRCKCHSADNCGCDCDPDEIEQHKYDHASENDCLSHAEKDYYGQCGCFDNSHGNPDTCGEEETL